MYTKKTAFLGVGNMASAVISANGGKNLDWNSIILFDKFGGKCAEFAPLGAEVASSVTEAVEKAECVFLAVKPQDYYTLLDEVKLAENYSDKLYISIGAGIETSSIKEYLGSKKVIRALPNTPMLIGLGVSAVCKTETVPTDEYEFAVSLFRSAGSVLEINESEMNRIISVTSSSPAYVFEFIQAIIDGAAAQELDTTEILTSVCDVVSGAALLLKSSGKTPAEMTAMVASKGGTTERALATLSEKYFSDTIISAMKACTERADELGKKN